MKEVAINENLKKNTFAKDVVKMASAPLCTQIMGIILMPIITRLYDPELFGVFNLFCSIVMPISVFVTMGYSSSIVLPKKDEVASNMLGVCLILTVIISILTTIFILFFSELLLLWLKAPEVGAYLWLIPLNVFVIGVYISLRFWNVRRKQFGRIAISRISNALINKVFIIMAAFSGFINSGSLILGAIFGTIGMIGVLGRKIWQDSGKLFERSIRWNKMFQGIKRYRKFPIYNLWTDWFSRLSPSIIIFLFSFYFSKSVIGYYGLGLAILGIPMTFMGSAIGEVFYQRGARARNENKSPLLVENLFKQMVQISMLPFFILIIIGDIFFGFVFGANWTEAGVYAQILSFKIFFSFITTPARTLTTILEKQEAMLILYILTTITSFLALIIGGLLNNVYIALCLLSLFHGFAFLGFGLLINKSAGMQPLRQFNILWKCFVSCVPIIIVAAFVKWYFYGSPLIIIIMSAIGCKKDKALQSTIVALVSKLKAA